MEKIKQKTHPMPFLNGLTLLFLYLQLTNQIHWPWCFVLAPKLLGITLLALRDLLIFFKYKLDGFYPEDK